MPDLRVTQLLDHPFLVFSVQKFFLQNYSNNDAKNLLFFGPLRDFYIILMSYPVLTENIFIMNKSLLNSKILETFSKK